MGHGIDDLTRVVNVLSAGIDVNALADGITQQPDTFLRAFDLSGSHGMEGLFVCPSQDF